MFVKLDTSGAVDKYPYTIGHLRRDNPNTSFPKHISNETLVGFGVYPVVQEPYPEYDPKTSFVEFGPVPELRDGKWTLPAVVRAYSDEQLAERSASKATEVRAERDRLLAETDWLVIKAYELNQNVPVQWEVYRQALRDITLQEDFPFNVTWPTKP